MGGRGCPLDGLRLDGSTVRLDPFDEKLNKHRELRAGRPLDVLGHRHHDVPVAVERHEFVWVGQLGQHGPGLSHLPAVVLRALLPPPEQLREPREADLQAAALRADQVTVRLQPAAPASDAVRRVY